MTQKADREKARQAAEGQADPERHAYARRQCSEEDGDQACCDGVWNLRPDVRNVIAACSSAGEHGRIRYRRAVISPASSREDRGASRQRNDGV